MLSLLLSLCVTGHHIAVNFDFEEAKNVLVSKALVASVVRRESAGVASETSPKGAKGLMQIMGPTYREWAPKVGLPANSDPYNADNNLKVGTAYLQMLLSKYDDLKLALAAYNWGLGHLDRLLEKHPGASFEDIRAHMPLETQQYVKKVMLTYALA